MPLSDERHDISVNARLIRDKASQISTFARWLDEMALSDDDDLSEIEARIREIQRCCETIQLRASAAMIAAREAKTKELAP